MDCLLIAEKHLFDPAVLSKAMTVEHDLIYVIMCYICIKKIKNEIQL